MSPSRPVVCVSIHRQSTPCDERLDRLRACDDPHCVVIPDEVDQLQNKDVLSDLQWTRNLIVDRQEDVFSFLDERLNSHFAGQR
ncbi:hypothetical protein [Haloquadratum walsbyi]|uniref:hypothetical protein n=1 Tax=Haloquadratum walsbyi TaxID=293091 RepID=UPI0026F269D6|nr:hypothetical protein [Haloquadratum walsbyi]